MTSFLLPVLVAFSSPTTVRGQYVEARTCDVFAGSCFANADTGLVGKHGVLAWKVESGSVGGVSVEGLGVLAVVSASDTLGLKQSAPGTAVIIVDEKATKEQRAALVEFVKAQAGKLASEVVAVRTAAIDLTVCNCDGEGCATLKAGNVKIVTRCINPDHDKACGNETTLYTPLAKGVAAKAAMATEHSYTGKDLDLTWSDSNRRGAFVGSFLTR